MAGDGAWSMGEDSDDDEWLDRVAARTGKDGLRTDNGGAEGSDQWTRRRQTTGSGVGSIGHELHLVEAARDFDKAFGHHGDPAKARAGFDTSDDSSNEGSEDEGEEVGASLTLPFEVCPRSPAMHIAQNSSGVIYKITCIVSRLSYVGLTMQDLEHRMSGHRTAARTASWPGKSLASAIAQYGWQAFNLEVLYRRVPLEVLGAMERVCIALHGTRHPFGYNRTSGGEFTRMTPDQKLGWEMQMALYGTAKQVATKRARREAKLAKMQPEVADALRERLDKEAARNRARHRGEELEPDGRFGRNDKRRATFAAKREARMALMTPEARAKYERINATKRRSDEKRIAKRMEANRSVDHVAWMKVYREENKDKRAVLGK
jgi:hypothetical protein